MYNSLSLQFSLKNSVARGHMNVLCLLNLGNYDDDLFYPKQLTDESASKLFQPETFPKGSHHREPQINHN